MSKGAKIWPWIITIIVFVIIEFITLAKFNEKSDKCKKLEDEIENLNSENQKLMDNLKEYSENPDVLLSAAKQAYYDSDAEKLARIYCRLRRYHNLAPGIDEVEDWVKRLNGRVDNENLRKVAQNIHSEEWERNSITVKMSEEESRQLQSMLNLAAKESQMRKDYGDAAVKKAGNKTVEIGWTKELCEAALGKPDKVSKNTSKDMVIESWYYFNEGNTTALNFTNGKLESINEY